MHQMQNLYDILEYLYDTRYLPSYIVDRHRTFLSSIDKRATLITFPLRFSLRKLAHRFYRQANRNGSDILCTVGKRRRDSN